MRNKSFLLKVRQEAINLVAHSYGCSQLQAGDEIVLSTMEHHANIVPWQRVCQHTGACLKIIPMDDNGNLLLADYLNLLSTKTKIVALTQASNAIGTINPIAEMIAAAKTVGAVTVIDGAQAVQHLAVDVTALDCDFYAFSGHKCYGPTGIGVLYGKQALLEAMPPYQTGGEMITQVSFERTDYHVIPHKFEAGTPNIAGAIGLGVAITYLQTLGLAAIAEHEQQLLAYATEQLQTIEGLRIIGQATQKVAVISFVLGDIHPHDIGTIVDQQGIAVRAGHHCAMPLMTRLGVPATVRVSFAAYNTTQEIDKLFVALLETQKVFR